MPSHLWKSFMMRGKFFSLWGACLTSSLKHDDIVQRELLNRSFCKCSINFRPSQNFAHHVPNQFNASLCGARFVSFFCFLCSLQHLHAAARLHQHACAYRALLRVSAQKHHLVDDPYCFSGVRDEFTVLYFNVVFWGPSFSFAYECCARTPPRQTFCQNKKQQQEKPRMKCYY